MHKSGKARPVFRNALLCGLLLSGLFAACVNPFVEEETPAANPQNPPNPPEKVTVTAGDGRVTLSWATPENPGLNDTAAVYKYQAWVVEDTLRIYADTGFSCAATVPDTTCTLTGLANGTEYRFVVAAFNKGTAGVNCVNHAYPGNLNGVFTAGRSCASALVRATPNGTVVTVPGAPRNVLAVSGNTQVTVSWTAPLSNGGAPITAYLVTAVSDTLKKCSTAGALTCTVTGLTNGKSYNFVVQATNSAGTGSDWAASPPVVPAVPIMVPGAPTAVTAVAGRAAATISWTAPTSNGGAAVNGYKAMAVSDTTRFCATGGTLSCTIINLVNGVPYTFVVRAANPAGSSAASAPSAAATPIAPPTWTGRTSGTLNTLTAVSFSGSLFVAVGVNGTLLSSPNGTNWTTRTSGVTATLSGVATSGSGSPWVAVGATGTVVTSPDGLNWTPRSSGATDSLRGVIRAGTQWVAVGNAGTILTSSDGTTWLARVSGTTQALKGVAWSGSVYAAVGAGGTIVTSPDGVNWTIRSAGTTNGFNGLVWTGTVFVAVGGDSAAQVTTSPDGVTWTSRATAAGGATQLYGVTWTGNQLLLVGSGGGVFGSATATGASESLTILSGNVYGAAGSPSQWVVVGAAGAITTSP